MSLLSHRNDREGSGCDRIIEHPKIIKNISFEIPISKLEEMKEEFHEISIHHNGILNEFNNIKEFYADLVNVLSGVEQ